MIDRLVTSPSIDLLERTLNFTEARHQLLVQNIANIDVPGYMQMDASPKEFQAALAKAVDQRRASFNAALDPESTDTVTFVAGSANVQLTPKPVRGAIFHDRGVRSVDTLMAQLADNAEAHNMAAQMLKGRFDTLRAAISLRAS